MTDPRTDTRQVTTRGSGRPGGPGPGSPQPRPALGWDRAGDSADQDTAGQDMGDRAFQPQGDPLPGQRQPGADDAVAEADVEPYFCSQEVVVKLSRFSVAAGIRCQVIGHEILADGREVVTVDTGRPDGLDSGGVTIFHVPASVVSD
jgi:hypothetical protein